MIKFNNKKTISAIISVVLLVLIAALLTGVFINWSKNISSSQLEDSKYLLGQSESKVNCMNSKLQIESVSFDDITDELKLVISNNTNITFSNFTLTVEGLDYNNNYIKAVADYKGSIDRGKIVILSTVDDFIFRDGQSLMNFNTFNLSNITLSNITCPNDSLIISEYDIVCNSGECDNISANITFSSSSIYTTGDTILFSSDIFGGVGNYECNWSVNDSLESYSCDNFNYTFLSSGSYDINLYVVDSQNHDGNDIVYIDVYDPLSSQITNPLDGSEQSLSSAVSFASSVTGSDGNYSCQWNINNSFVNDSCVGFDYIFSSPGSYDINFTVEDNYGSSNTNLINISVFGTASTPVFNPGGGSYTNSVNIELTTTTPDGIIRYTTDNTTPTESHGTIYTSPITLSAPADLNIMAIAYADYYNSSSVSQETYNVAFPDYNVGDTGPAGGTIFYKKAEYSDGWRYLEIENTTRLNEVWGCSGTYLGTSSSLGSGITNTSTIVSNCSGTTQASVCNNLSQGGYSDWFLGSKDEIEEYAISSVFVVDTYSCSTDVDADNFYFRNQWAWNNTGGKSYAGAANFRCIRRF